MTRAPDHMPTDWKIARFDLGLATGYLKRDGEDEVSFDISAWSLPEEYLPRGDEASLKYPQAKEPVRVTWRTSRLGKVVPAVVEPVGRDSLRARHTFQEWLKAVQERAGILKGLLFDDIVEALAEQDEDFADLWDPDEAYDAAQYTDLLYALGTVEDQEFQEQLATWLYVDDHRWDRDLAKSRLPKMVGLSEAVDPNGDAESFTQYLRRVDDRAKAASTTRRLFDLAHESDYVVAIAAPHEGMRALEKDRLLKTW